MGTKSEVDWSKNVANKGHQLDVQLHVGSVLHEVGWLVVDHEAEPPDRLTAGSMLLHKLQSPPQLLQYFPNQEFAYRADSC